MMPRKILFPFLFTASVTVMGVSAIAQETPKDILHVAASTLHTDAENAELCIDFDKPVVAPPPSALHAEEDGKNISLQNITATASSLCLYPLHHGHAYQINLAAMRGTQGEELAVAFKKSFTVPDRMPLLAFTGLNGGVNGFGAFESPFTLRAINVPHTAIDVYRITDIAAMARAWQDRAQTTLAPTESLYIAHNKGQAVWHSILHTDATTNKSSQTPISLRPFLPDLPAGLYLMTASTGKDGNTTPPNTLSPLAASWFTKSDFTLRAMRDPDSLHVFATTALAAKANLRLIAVGKQQETIAETQTDIKGTGVWPTTLPLDAIASVIGLDESGNVGFADVEPLPVLSEPSASAKTEATPNDDYDTVTLKLTSENEQISSTPAVNLTLQTLGRNGKPAPLIDGHVLAVWQKRDPAQAGWKDFVFGTQMQTQAQIQAQIQAQRSDPYLQIGDFLTDLQGTAHLHAALPKPPPEPGLYQVILVTDSDQKTIGNSLTLPWRPDDSVIGIKALAPDAHFIQNSLARFALIALGNNEKPRDQSGLTYQFYEEGRHFDWYQDNGKWNYKREPQLRPIGGGNVTIKADGSTILEWPVTAGNYRLEILDANAKTVAQTTFSAGWMSTNAVTNTQNLPVDFPHLLRPLHEATVHFHLPAAAMVTGWIADGRIRQTIQEFRAKGDNVITFTPGEDWQSGVSLTLSATATVPDQAPLVYRAVAQAPLIHDAKPVPDAASGAMIATHRQSLTLRPGGVTHVTAAIENRSASTENFSMHFSSDAGLTLNTKTKGQIRLDGHQHQQIDFTVTSDAANTQAAVKNIKLDVVSSHGVHSSQNWNVALLPAANSLTSGDVVNALPQQILVPAYIRNAGDMVALVARHPLNGFGEILSFVFNAHPFTTPELAGSIEALRLWQDTLAQTGLAPEAAIAALREEWMTRLLHHQNSDGSFARLRDGNGTLADTATALIALGPDSSERVRAPRAQAVAYLRQHLANTWFDSKERADRAAAYAGLAAANAIDAASLHYFSDITAPDSLPPLAAAHVAAAFKQSRDPNAAAFWIGKMLENMTTPRAPLLLGALAATDALSSDDVHAAMQDMAAQIHQNIRPDITEATALLRAVAADMAHAGKGRLTTGTQSRDISTAVALRLNDPNLPTARNGGTQPVAVSLASFATAPQPATLHSTLTRHIYHLNGVEIKPPAKFMQGETYMVELSGKLPPLRVGEEVLVQDYADSSLQPIGCALSAKIDVMGFMPWLTTRDLTNVGTCDKNPFGIDALLAVPSGDSRPFRIVYFATIDAPTHGHLSPPTLRVIKQDSL